ncbi:MAG: LacI family DNA-binding transcriptional regulator [Eubacteriales bacterium]|jgi:DNA-binding LacI/PurR family transcriptional regulator
MAIRIKDIAKLAGVSPATVSLALNGSELVNEDTRKRIISIAHEHGYIPNTYARRLAMRRSGMLGLVIPDIENVYYASLVRMTNNYAQTAGYGLSILISDNSRELEGKIVTELISARVEGVICVPANIPGSSGEIFARLTDATIPVVCATTRFEPGSFIPSVMCGLREGMYEVASYLFRRGRRRPVYITGPSDVYTLDIRRSGFLDAARDAGIGESELKIIELPEVNYAAACVAAQQIADSGGNFDAAVCVNDMMALGVVNTLSRRGFDIPRDIAITGYDDVIFAEASPTPLTTVRQDIDSIARESIALLTRLIGGLPPDEAGDIVLPTQLVIRQST